MIESQHPWSATRAGCPLVTEVVTEVAVTSGQLVVVTVLKSTSDAMLVVGGEDGGDIIWRGDSVLLITKLLPYHCYQHFQVFRHVYVWQITQYSKYLESLFNQLQG